jgi:hypothetical protein
MLAPLQVSDSRRLRTRHAQRARYYVLHAASTLVGNCVRELIWFEKTVHTARCALPGNMHALQAP